MSVGGADESEADVCVVPDLGRWAISCVGGWPDGRFERTKAWSGRLWQDW